MLGVFDHHSDVYDDNDDIIKFEFWGSGFSYVVSPMGEECVDSKAAHASACTNFDSYGRSVPG